MPAAFCFYTGDCKGTVEVMIDGDTTVRIPTLRMMLKMTGTSGLAMESLSNGPGISEVLSLYSPRPFT